MTERDQPGDLQVEKVDFDPFAGGDLDRIVPMTGPQQEIWTSVQLGDDGNCAFNESVAVTLRGALDQEALALAFNDVVARHEALRATCTTDGRSLCIVRSLNVALPLLDLSAEKPEAAAQRYAGVLEGASTTPFDLEHGPLIRATLVRLAADHHVLVMTGHHIVCDGWSTGVILEDMGKCYTARKRNTAAGLRPADAFSDYALAMAERSRDGQDAKDAAYWLGVFGAPPEPLELPADRQRPALRTFAADRYDYALDAPLVASLKKLAGRSGVTFLSVMVTGLGSFLCRISGQRDLVIGVPAAGQFSSSKHGLVGHCVSLMPIRLGIDPDRDVSSTLKALRPVMLDAFDHEYIPEHMLTREFLQEVKGLLAAKGVLAANTFSKSSLYNHESATYYSVFGDFYRINKHNRVILLRMGGLPAMPEIAKNAARLEDRLRPFGTGKGELLSLFTVESDWPADTKILTDQYSPSNLLNSRRQ